MLSIKNLHVSVKNNKILEGLDIDIQNGELHVVMGPNGSGKSTLANVISGKENYKVEKYEILTPIKFNQKITKGEIIAKLKNRSIIAPFDGVIGKRDFSDDIKVSESSLVINLEDASILYVDVDIPEIYATYVKEGLKVDVKFSIIFCIWSLCI